MAICSMRHMVIPIKLQNDTTPEQSLIWRAGAEHGMSEAGGRTCHAARPPPLPAQVPAAPSLGFPREPAAQRRALTVVGASRKSTRRRASPSVLDPLPVGAPLGGLTPLPNRAGSGSSGSSSSSSALSLLRVGTAPQQHGEQRGEQQQQQQQHGEQQHEPEWRPQGPGSPPAYHEQQQQQQYLEAAMALPAAHKGTLWGLGIMTLAYLHLSVTIYALPSLLPFISDDLALNDTQGALLTTGYTILYGLALVPVGMVADSVNRPRLLAAGVALWSLLTMAASQSSSFGQLLATRVVFAAAQATCNPVAYSLIPELFPNNRTAAMAVYNTAIYAGRGLSFVVVMLAGHQIASMAQGTDLAAAVDGASAAWRPLLWWLGPPGLLTAALALWTVEEPRQKSSTSGRFLPLVTLSAGSMDDEDASAAAAAEGAAAAAAAALGTQPGGQAAYASLAQHAGGPSSAAAMSLQPGMLVSVPEPASEASPPGEGALAGRVAELRQLLGNRPFLALTGATAFGDIASWALIGWQATFYQRVYELEPSVYAPLVAVGITVGGIMGGIGSGLFGDRMTRAGARGWLTAGTSLAAAPLMAASFLMPDYEHSFMALLVGYAFSECWRAPAAVMVREVSPPGMHSTASAVNLCVRQLLGALGPIGVAALSSKFGLQYAMLLIPACHMAAGISLAAVEGVIREDKAKARAERRAAVREHHAHEHGGMHTGAAHAHAE